MPPPFSITQEACAHCWDESAVTTPHHQSAVHKEECAYCCRTCMHNGGVLVCMCCHIALCEVHVRKHVSLRSNHAMYVWLKECPQKEDEAPRDVNKLGVVLPKEYESAICCALCSLTFSSPPELLEGCYQSILNATSTGAQGAIDANEEQFTRPQCPHLVCLEQQPSPFSPAPSHMETCVVAGCGCQTDNWMCVTCGAVGCPRPEVGGRGHALEHHNTTQHPVVVKLGTITPSGADFYCYSCDDEVSDVHFEAHMKHFGIDVKTSKKTAKTFGEIQYDYWSQFDFNRITESGETLVPVFGPGRTGMRNFGNTCYMNCVLQCLMSLEVFKEAFYAGRDTRHQNACRENPYKCRSCQVERVASGLLSGEFSISDNDEPNGITAREFKQVFAEGHPEFSTSEQQDAQEYFLYLLEEMRRYVKPSCVDAKQNRHPVDIFKMKLENRVECSSCRKVRYTYESDCCLSLPIPLGTAERRSACNRKLTEEEIEASRPRTSLEACITSLMKTIEVDCSCSACGNQVTYNETVRVTTFPDVLAVYLRRAHFDAETMTVTKRDVFVEVPEEVDLEYLRGKGLQSGEVEMPSNERELRHKPVSAALTPVDEMALATLLSMGVDEKIAKYALQQTGMNVERALDYVFSRNDIEGEIARAEGSEGQLVSRGNVTAPEVDGPASYRLHAMISHMGASAKTGHYVCHIRDEETGKWLLFNDEKVAESKQPPFALASLYFYKRKRVSN
ncbi:ubiquitin hydrolase [Trypanosoma brucei equiperdum]|uniref:Ubiquitin carboxyl-terminal hydrolase n=1 Tax=Trypanosoma brucei equiperdum TaxID=630700 RepID=A0A3L6LGS5_9TRYP|nr:ubiquitin hydrolase [Trypanosoma brucei equiperdum]